MSIETLFLDLDGTLYPHENGMWDLIAKKMEIYMHQELGIPEKDVPSMRFNFFTKYGTTLRGLLANYTFDPEEYLTFVHDVPVTDFIEPDDELRQMLINLPQPKWILTNSDKHHAKRVLSALGVDDLFENVLGVSDLNFRNKPDLYVYEQALITAGNPPPKNCLFVDDLPKNLVPAWEMGFVTVLVGQNEKNHAADFHIREIKELPVVFTTME